ncbi:7-dehydrocholesterol reductase [Balamuthia mandrillaris]
MSSGAQTGTGIHRNPKGGQKKKSPPPSGGKGHSSGGDGEEVVLEFGGYKGALGLMIFSHSLMLYLWISLRYYQGSVIYPSSLEDVGPFFGRMWGHLKEGAMPTWEATGLYMGFLAFQLLLAFVLPGLSVKGLRVPSEGNRQLIYLCNNYACWLVTLVALGAIHYSGVFKLGRVIDVLGSIMVVSMIFSDALSVLTYLVAFATGKTVRMTGNHLYDFFMGAYLNPRLGKVDLKLFGETRVWTLLFVLTACAAAKQHELYGVVTWPMWFMVAAHGIYAHACAKGEHFIPACWDIFYEKWGWMLIYWNFAGVPFVYCFSSMWLLKHEPFEHSTPYTVALFVLLFLAYYAWDTANAQHKSFRLQQAGNFISRPWAIPQLPWSVIENPRYLKTKAGTPLLIDGWYRYVRKINYLGDIVMAFLWGMACGFDAFLPYFYAIFFTGMILHRGIRDNERCSRKYGEDWDRYCKEVPYILIPFVW